MPPRFTLALTSLMAIGNPLLSAAASMQLVGSGMTMSDMQMPAHYSSPVPTASAILEPGCLIRKGPKVPIPIPANHTGVALLRNETVPVVECFKSYYKFPASENLVVASVDAATNITQSISQLIQDGTGKTFQALVPIVISDLRTLTATVATAVAHIALATAKGIFSSDSLVYSLRGFVTAIQSVSDAFIGPKGFFSQYPLLTPLRTSILALEGVVNQFILLVANLIPKSKTSMAMMMHSQMDQALNKMLEALPN